MTTLRVFTLLAFVAVCFGGGNPGLNNGPEKDGATGVIATCVDCPPMPDPDPNCVIKGNQFRGSQHNTAKVWICHGTSSETNPYVLINVDDASLWQGHFDGGAPGHGKNNHPDIWPNSVGYDGLLYDCNCERVLPEEEEEEGPEVFAVILNVNHGANCIDNDGHHCEDELVRVSIGQTFTTECGLDLTSCDVYISALPPGTLVLNSDDNETVGSPTSGSASYFWKLTCEEARSIDIQLPPNYDKDLALSFTVKATRDSCRNNDTNLEATNEVFTDVQIQPINDPPVIGFILAGVIPDEFSSAPKLNLYNTWGYATNLQTETSRFSLADIDLDTADPDHPLQVHVTVSNGVVCFDTDTTVRLQNVITSQWEYVTIPARPRGSVTHCFSEIEFQCLKGSTTSLEICSEVLNSLHYLAPNDFAGEDNIKIEVDDIGSTGACLLPGPALWSKCTSDFIDIPINVVCERGAPLAIDDNEDNVYANAGTNIPNSVKTIYNPTGGGGPKGDLGDKIAICHGTSSDTNPWNFIVVSKNAYYGHFLSRTCKNDGTFDSVNRVTDDYTCCLSATDEALRNGEVTSDEAAEMNVECSWRVFEACEAYVSAGAKGNPKGQEDALSQCCVDVSGADCVATKSRDKCDTCSGHGTKYHDVFLGDAYRGGNPSNDRTFTISDCPVGFGFDDGQCTAEISCSCNLVVRGPSHKRLILTKEGITYSSSLVGDGTTVSDSDSAQAAGAGAATADSASADKDTLYSLLGAGVAVALVGLVVVGALYRRRRGSKKADVEADAATAAAADTNRKPKANSNLTWVQEMSEVEPSTEGSILALAAAIEAADDDERSSLVNGN